MTAVVRTRRTSARALLALAAAGSLVLAGCSSSPGPVTSASPSPSVSPSATDAEDEADETLDSDFTAEDIVDLQPGSCVLWSAIGPEEAGIPTVPCTEEHDTVILSVVELPEGEYPEEDTDAFETLSTETVEPACEAAFEEWDSGDRDRAAWEFDSLWPAPEEWDLGYRKLQCYAFDTTAFPEDDGAEIDLGDGVELDEGTVIDEGTEIEIDENGDIVE